MSTKSAGGVRRAKTTAKSTSGSFASRTNVENDGGLAAEASSAQDAGRLSTDDDRWLERAQEVATFYAEHGVLPSRPHPLGRWLDHAREASRGTADDRTWTLARQVWLDENVPGWATPSEVRWLNGAQEVADFYAEHGRFPTRKEPGGHWLASQRVAAGGKGDRAWSAQRQAWMDEHLPGWDVTEQTQFSHDDDRWLERSQEVIAFLNEHQRLPRRTEPGGQWLTDQRKAKGREKRPLTPARQAWLDENLPGWDVSPGRVGRSGPSPADEARWHARAQKVADYYAIHGRFPEQPHSLGFWLAHARMAARGKGGGPLSPERQAWLDEHLPGWDRTRRS